MTSNGKRLPAAHLRCPMPPPYNICSMAKYALLGRNPDLEMCIFDGWLGSERSVEWMRSRTNKTLPEPYMPPAPRGFASTSKVLACLQEDSYTKWASSSTKRRHLAAAAEQAGLPSFPENISDFFAAVKGADQSTVLRICFRDLPATREEDRLFDGWRAGTKEGRSYSTLDLESPSGAIVSNAWGNSRRNEIMSLRYRQDDAVPDCLNRVSEYSGAFLTIEGDLRIGEECMSNLMEELAKEAYGHNGKTVYIQRNRHAVLPPRPPLEGIKRLARESAGKGKTPGRSSRIYFHRTGASTQGVPARWLEAIQDTDDLVPGFRSSSCHTYSMLCGVMAKQPESLLTLHFDHVFGRREHALAVAPYIPSLSKQKGHVGFSTGSTDMKSIEQEENYAYRKFDLLSLEW